MSTPHPATTPLSLVIDTDTGSDDAVALIMAARLPGVQIRAVTTVAGNVPLELATRNALITLERCGRGDVPVHVGSGTPLLRPPEDAVEVHGEDGMGDIGLADPAMAARQDHAVDVLRRIAAEESGQHVLVTLGPLTNIAAAVLLDPNLLTRFAGVVAMGGAFDGVGNAHRIGEYNIWADPEAAKIVVDAPGTVTFVGWDMSRRYAVVTPEEQDQLRSLGPMGEFAVDINCCVDRYAREVSGLAGYDLPDPIAMAIAIDPTVATGYEDVHLDIGLDDASRGGTIADRRHLAPAPNARIVTGADEAAFKAMLAAACTG